MIELKEEIDKELNSIKNRKEELKEEVFSRIKNEQISSLKLNFPHLIEESKFFHFNNFFSQKDF